MYPELSVEDAIFIYNEPITLTLNYNHFATGKVNVTISDKSRDFVYQLDLNRTIQILDTLSTGVYNVTVDYGGDEAFFNTSANATLTIVKAVPEISIDSHDINVTDINAIIAYIILPGSVSYDGNVTVTIDGEPQTRYVSEAIHHGPNIAIPIYNNGLKIGDYNIAAIYNGDNNYNASEIVKDNFSVLIIETTITLAKKSIILGIGGNSTIEYTLTPWDAVGEVTFKSNDSSVVNVNPKTGEIKALGEGSATITIEFSGSENYTKSNASVNVNVVDYNVILLVDNLTKYYHGFEKFNVTVLDLNGQPIKNKTVAIEINGLNYNRTTDENGTAFLAINLDSGEYIATVTCDDDTKKATVTVLSTINATNIIKTYGDNTTFDATLLDSEGNPLKENTTVTLNINGVIFEANVIGNAGLASFVIDISAGNHTGTVINTNGEKKAYNITVLKTNSSIAVYGHDISVSQVDATVVDVVLPGGATGSVNIAFGNETKTYDINSTPNTNRGGDLVLFIPNPGLKAGACNISAVYNGDNNFYPSDIAECNLTVFKGNITPNIKTVNKTVSVGVPKDAKGNITIAIGNEIFSSPIKYGIAVFDLLDVPEGNYTALINYLGDENYNGFKEEVNLTLIDPVGYEVRVDDVVKYYHGPERLVVNVYDLKGKAIPNQLVQITINGVTYNRTTDNNGSVSMAINLNAGEYKTVVRVNDTIVNSIVTVITTVNGTDITKIYKNATQYYATFRDSEGNYLKDGTTVKFNINGVMYERKVSGDKGLAKLNINLDAGKYIITNYNTVTGEENSNTVKVFSKLIENRDITKYYKNATQYTVKVLGDDGKVVSAGKTVKFNINGVIYERQTNASGIAKLNINLDAGDYIITAEYEGCAVSNKIKVLPILTAKDLTKKYGTSDPFIVNLVDGKGKAFANQTVQFNVNGVMYNRVTDGQGQAKLNIRLMPSEYIITSMYNGAAIGNKITILS